MSYAVKNVKTFSGMEGYGFNASLYKDSKKIAFVIDEGNGGCMDACPLLASGENCQDPNSVYSGWVETDIDDAETRGQCAARIVQIIEAWEV